MSTTQTVAHPATDAASVVPAPTAKWYESTGAWWHGTLAGFDLETTGIDPRTDRIVSAAFVIHHANGTRTKHAFVLNPGIDVPVEASDVHGYTTERIQAEGTDYREGIIAIRDLIEAHGKDMPIVAFNGAFDFTMITVECIRLGITPPTIRVVLDPLVMDRIRDAARWGKRTLTALTTHYRVPLVDAHDATADADAAILLARAILDRTPATITPWDFHKTQRAHRAVQEAERQAKLRKWKKDESIVCEPGWPLYDPLPVPAAA